VARAAAEAWPIAADHCFLRIAYDDAVQERWDRVCARPAWRHLPPDRLAAALAALERLSSEGLAALRALNAASLAWRRAPANGAANITESSEVHRSTVSRR
jgi:hypothetical protein